jgi:hypothetical protein
VELEAIVVAAVGELLEVGNGQGRVGLLELSDDGAQIGFERGSL